MKHKSKNYSDSTTSVIYFFVHKKLTNHGALGGSITWGPTTDFTSGISHGHEPEPCSEAPHWPWICLGFILSVCPSPMHVGQLLSLPQKYLRN